jgi:AbrB family looped-hinge helix DNA binding protein
MRITSKGQITIPQEIRLQLGLHPGDEVDVVADGGAARIVPAGGLTTRGRRVVESLLGKGDVDLSTDQIMAMTRGG